MAARPLGSRRRTRWSYHVCLAVDEACEPREDFDRPRTRAQNGYASSGTSGHARPLHEPKNCSVSSENVHRTSPRVDARPLLVVPCREGVSEPPGLRLRCQLRRSRAKHHDCQFPPVRIACRRSRAALCIRAGGSEVLRTGSEIECGARLRHPGPENSRSRAGGARGQFRPERRARRRSAARCRASENRGRTGPWP